MAVGDQTSCTNLHHRNIHLTLLVTLCKLVVIILTRPYHIQGSTQGRADCTERLYRNHSRKWLVTLCDVLCCVCLPQFGSHQLFAGICCVHTGASQCDQCDHSDRTNVTTSADTNRDNMKKWKVPKVEIPSREHKEEISGKNTENLSDDNYKVSRWSSRLNQTSIFKIFRFNRNIS